VDDHKLFRKGLRQLIEVLSLDYDIVFEAGNGLEMQWVMETSGDSPDVLVMDVNMPGMDGFESVAWLKEHHPSMHILVLSMIEEEASIIRMIKLGVLGYLSKDVEPEELHQALQTVSKGQFYYTDFLTGKLIHALQHPEDNPATKNPANINDRESKFIELACTEMTYQQIADKMCSSPKTIDGYRKNLFEKLNVKSRVGLAMLAVRQGLVTP
jgi:DNA-binding NarL/FixJ family response regulator